MRWFKLKINNEKLKVKSEKKLIYEFILNIVFRIEFVIGDSISMLIDTVHNGIVIIFLTRCSIFTFVIIGAWTTRVKGTLFVFVWGLIIFWVLAIIEVYSIVGTSSTLKSACRFHIARR